MAEDGKEAVGVCEFFSDYAEAWQRMHELSWRGYNSWLEKTDGGWEVQWKAQ